VRPVDWSEVTHYLDSVVAGGAAPGAVLGVSHDGIRFVYGTGRLGVDDPTRPDGSTVYDLASLTKAVALTTVTMMAVDRGKLALDTPVWRYLPGFRGGGRDSVTLRLLLIHASGLPAWRPLYRETTTRSAALALVDSTPLGSPPGTRYEYSDLGAMVLTQVVEGALGHRIDTLAAREVFEPLHMSSTRYLPPAEWTPRIAPTEDDPWRGRVLRGEVHDENAARLDGVSGHAGLFSDTDDLLTFAEWMLRQANWRSTALTSQGGPAKVSGCIGPSSGAGGEAPPSPSVAPATVLEFTRRQRLVAGSSRALGWDTPSDGSSAGTLLSSESFGHTGFTGTSLWIDPEGCLAIVLLSNRVHPTRNNQAWGPVRGQVADRVVEALDRSTVSR
jgi:CubicO group peptidase (beta-lactamase class C family)